MEEVSRIPLAAERGGLGKAGADLEGLCKSNHTGRAAVVGASGEVVRLGQLVGDND